MHRIDRLTMHFVARIAPTTCIGVASPSEREPSGHLCADCIISSVGTRNWDTMFDKYWWGRHRDCHYTHAFNPGGEPGCAACNRLFTFLTPDEWEALCRDTSTS